MANRFATLRAALLIVSGVAATGCDVLPDREFTELERSLELTIEGAQRTPSGGAVLFTFKIHNRGQQVASACLGPSRNVSYDTSGSGGESFTGVSHPGCVTTFTIQPGGDMVWSETLEVPRLTDRHGEVEVHVQVLNPRRCSRVGCAATEFRSNRRKLP